MPEAHENHEVSAVRAANIEQHVDKYRDFYSGSMPVEPGNHSESIDMVWYKEAKKFYLYDDQGLDSALRYINLAIKNTSDIHHNRLAYYYNLKACIILTRIVLDHRITMTDMHVYQDTAKLGQEVNLNTVRACLEKALSIAEHANITVPWQIYLNLARLAHLTNNQEDRCEYYRLACDASPYDFSTKLMDDIYSYIISNFDVLQVHVLRRLFAREIELPAGIVVQTCEPVVARRFGL